jgi:hypothetical protein
LPALLDLGGYVAVAVVVAVGLQHLCAHLTISVAVPGGIAFSKQAVLYFGWIAGAIALASGTWIGFKEKLRFL